MWRRENLKSRNIPSGLCKEVRMYVQILSVFYFPCNAPCVLSIGMQFNNDVLKVTSVDVDSPSPFLTYFGIVSCNRYVSLWMRKTSHIRYVRDSTGRMQHLNGFQIHSPHCVSAGNYVAKETVVKVGIIWHSLRRKFPNLAFQLSPLPLKRQTKIWTTMEWEQSWNYSGRKQTFWPVKCSTERLGASCLYKCIL